VLLRLLSVDSALLKVIVQLTQYTVRIISSMIRRSMRFLHAIATSGPDRAIQPYRRAGCLRTDHHRVVKPSRSSRGSEKSWLVLCKWVEFAIRFDWFFSLLPAAGRNRCGWDDERTASAECQCKEIVELIDRKSEQVTGQSLKPATSLSSSSSLEFIICKARSSSVDHHVVTNSVLLSTTNT